MNVGVHSICCYYLCWFCSKPLYLDVQTMIPYCFSTVTYGSADRWCLDMNYIYKYL